MAPFAARSAGICKFDGFIVIAAELCIIVRASYLNPSFPFLLCFELWQHLWRQVQKGTSGESSAVLEEDLKDRRRSFAPVVSFEQPLLPYP
jgi:hypothetical protein